MKYPIFVLTGFSLLLAGCSMDASLLSLNSALPNVADPFTSTAKTTGLVSGSQQTGTTDTGNYIVQSSLGSYISGMKQTTTDNEYVVYSSVQGSLIKEE